MTFDEMKEAWIRQVPVIVHTEIINPTPKYTGEYKYKRIIGFAQELPEPGGNIKVIVKLEDYCGHSEAYTKPENIRSIKDDTRIETTV